MRQITPYIELKLAWSRLGYTQKEVAELCGMDPGKLSRRMNGAQPWNLWEMARVAKLLGIPQEESAKYWPLVDLAGTGGKSNGVVLARGVRGEPSACVEHA